MKMMKLISNNYICVNRNLAEAIGLDEAIVLSELVDEYCFWNEAKGRQDGTNRSYLEDGWFYSTVPNLIDRTKLSKYQISSAVTKLVSLGLIKKKVCGMPAKTWFSFGKDEEDALECIINNDKNFQASSSQKTRQQEVKKLDNKKLKNCTQINLSKEPKIINLKNITTTSNCRIATSDLETDCYDQITHLPDEDYYKFSRIISFSFEDSLYPEPKTEKLIPFITEQLGMEYSLAVRLIETAASMTANRLRTEYIREEKQNG